MPVQAEPWHAAPAVAAGRESEHDKCMRLNQQQGAAPPRSERPPHEAGGAAKHNQGVPPVGTSLATGPQLRTAKRTPRHTNGYHVFGVQDIGHRDDHGS